jgi:hypothetical protein
MVQRGRGLDDEKIGVRRLEGTSPEFVGRMVVINRIYGGKSPKGLYIRQPRASVASPWEKTSILRTLKGFNIEYPRRERARFVVPLQGTRITNRLPRAALRLP